MRAEPSRAPLLTPDPPTVVSAEHRWFLLLVREGLLVIVRGIERVCRLERS